MNKYRRTLLLSLLLAVAVTHANEPDHGWLRPFVNGRGLAFDYSSDSLHWQRLGHGRTFVDSDFGTWGAEKKMADPCLTRDDDGLWTLRWIPNPRYDLYAVCTSPDLIHWKPQDYPALTDDVRAALAARPLTVKVEWSLIERLQERCDYLDQRQKALDERLTDDGVRFAGLQPFALTVTPDTAAAKAISDKLIGIFFEDISYGADGGLYAELVQNRDFEYVAGENGDPSWGPLKAWSMEHGTMAVDTVRPIHAHNAHYVRVTADAGGRLCNGGYDVIPLQKGESYRLSFFGRKGDAQGPSARLTVALMDADGRTVAHRDVTIGSREWKRQECVLKADADASATLVIEAKEAAQYCLDMVSLFPVHTFHGHRNGLRADLAQAIADIHPAFVRFPGGCVAHGNGLDNMYLWKKTIGPLEERQPMRNIWGYHQSMGLGYYEYFLFCEDIGAEPLPVIPAGVPCQNSSIGGPGQQGGVPMEQMEAFTQDILDLIEWANGDAKTTYWGRVRAAAGHPKPFGLHYVGIGNEDLISDVFAERFTYIYNKVHERYPDIRVCGTVGPFYEGSDYDWGWRLASELQVPLVDEHYYVSPGWYLHNQDFYDHYDRSKPHVYLGEYACHIDGRRNCLETALCEALHLLNLERNGDVVEMSSYAPLLARERHTNWNPDMIYFNATGVRLTPGYYVQQMCGQNVGSRYVPCTLTPAAGTQRMAAAAAYRTAASMVVDDASGDVIFKFANLLPVAVTATVALPAGTATVTTLTSNDLGDTRCTPRATTIGTDGNAMSHEFPPYSFNVIRTKATK